MPLCDSVDEKDTLNPEEQAKKDTENLKKTVVTFFDVAEQAIVAGVKAAQATPAAAKRTVEFAKSLPIKAKEVKSNIESLQRDVKNLPTQLQAKQVHATRRAKEKRRQIATLKDEIDAFGKNTMKWVTLDEPKESPRKRWVRHRKQRL